MLSVCCNCVPVRVSLIVVAVRVSLIVVAVHEEVLADGSACLSILESDCKSPMIPGHRET